ncbi:MAG: orotidine-5'-phosphate decarboxylase [Planctomycetes bacterium]|nr:orotidine-5'-phosphate decarboxylase [Planctomycetota bacterium]
MHAADLIQAAIDRTRSIACVGLDPRPNLIPKALADAAIANHGDTVRACAEAFFAYNRDLIRAIAGACAAVKPQMACYEAYGSAGMRALELTVACAHEHGIPVIIDGKRNDIGSTAEHYAQAYLAPIAPTAGRSPLSLAGSPLPGLGAAWLTVNAYLGSDGVKPFLAPHPAATGIFVLVKTSNASSGELQDVACDHGPVMERMARLVTAWGAGRIGRSGMSDVGAVVGATYPQQARRLRELMPDALFLVPGYGAQGASAADATAGARADGRGVLVNSSRAIMGAWQDQRFASMTWADAARAALDAMNADLATGVRTAT